MAWGNGACRADGTWFENVLTEFASHGFLVIANGVPGGTGQTSSDMLIEAVDWAIEENSDPDCEFAGRIDTSEIAVMGQSCGGRRHRPERVRGTGLRDVFLRMGRSAEEPVLTPGPVRRR